MSALDKLANVTDVRRYLREVPKLESRAAHARWALTNPLQSYTGGKALEAYVDDRPPAAWAADMADQDVLIVGSGPSLDRVDDEFFTRFATAIHINLVIRRHAPSCQGYFFTTDLGPVEGYLENFGEETFLSLGPERCILAPIFLDQWHMMKAEGRALFTMLRHDRAGWRTQNTSFGPLSVPYTLRYHPVQPNWTTFVLPPGGRTLPVLDHTSALTAVILAAMSGARRIGLIGCDFSAGERSKFVQGAQGLPAAKFFSGAANELAKIATALARFGVEVTIHAWEV